MVVAEPSTLNPKSQQAVEAKIPQKQPEMRVQLAMRLPAIRFVHTHKRSSTSISRGAKVAITNRNAREECYYDYYESPSESLAQVSAIPRLAPLTARGSSSSCCCCCCQIQNFGIAVSL